jgi:hypothetical protein
MENLQLSSPFCWDASTSYHSRQDACVTIITVSNGDFWLTILKILMGEERMYGGNL